MDTKGLIALQAGYTFENGLWTAPPWAPLCGLKDPPDCKWTRTLEIPNPETAAYIAALIFNADISKSEFLWTSMERIRRHFPGGLDAAKQMESSLRDERHKIWLFLVNALNSIGIQYNSSAPWVDPEITYLGKEDVNGTLSIDQMKAAIKRCEEE